MRPIEELTTTLKARRRRGLSWRDLHLDPPLTAGLLLLALVGLTVLYSAGGQSWEAALRQLGRLALGFGVMLVVAQIPPHNFERWATKLYGAGVVLLTLVLLVGDISMGAQRWLDLGIIRFQPSEIMKIAVPMMVTWYLAEKSLPPSPSRLAVGATIIAVPFLLIAKQPDLGTAVLVGSSGVFVLLLAGMAWRIVGALALTAAAAAPLAWYLLHDYQRQRIITFLDPEHDPLGAGYHIIQSKIALGSGGIYGKGWLNGTQSHLEYLPESSTDFIFAVLGEEFGIIGATLLLSIYLFVILRGLYIATQAQDTFTRLLAGSISLTFFVYVFVNMGMVTGLLPVVGVPLPLVSYGGTSMVTVMAAFGILMSIHTHRKLVST